ncbi:transposase, partial [Marinimicrobium locisalis]|uniref:transposase n=1 Tax=Marinimicrobium locisalis TaxID=546022 RepID=UPI003221EADC
WVAHCERVGRGQEALQYLARYLYRGVISNRNILDDDGTTVTFRYQNSRDRQWQTRTLPGEDFLWLLLQHVLPKGFRRARDYGFLHGNARPLLNLLQWLLRVPKPPPVERHSVSLPCPHCQGRMRVTGMRPARERPG